jgi:hypothetical protein
MKRANVASRTCEMRDAKENSDIRSSRYRHHRTSFMKMPSICSRFRYFYPIHAISTSCISQSSSCSSSLSCSLSPLGLCSPTSYFSVCPRCGHSSSNSDKLLRRRFNLMHKLERRTLHDTAGDGQLSTHTSKVRIHIASRLATFVDAPNNHVSTSHLFK